MYDVNISTKRDFGIPRILYHLERLFDNMIKRDDVQVNMGNNRIDFKTNKNSRQLKMISYFVSICRMREL